MESDINAIPLNWVNVAGVAVALLITFWLVFREVISRTSALLLGATICIIWGTLRGFFPAEDALQSVSLQTLILLVTMTVISNVLDAGGLFTHLGIVILRASGGNRQRLFVLLCMFTYAFSLIVDNLTVMVIAGTLTIGLLAELRLDPRPYITGVLISTNTGGASTAIGDFPNMILAERGGIPFLAFLGPLGMFWVCLAIQIFIVTFLCWQFRAALQTPDDLNSRLTARFTVAIASRRLPAAIQSRRAIASGLTALAIAIALFATSGTLHRLSPTEIGLIASLLALGTAGLDHERMINEVGLSNVMAFVGLFILAGAAEKTGIITAFGQHLVSAANGNPLIIALAIIVPIALVTACVDAGPTTAAFVPLIASLNRDLEVPGNLLWWTLSLGVLAGSSATILGATAGTIAAGQVDRWRLLVTRDPSAPTTFNESSYVASFSRSGLPVAVIILTIGAVFLVTGFIFYI